MYQDSRSPYFLLTYTYRSIYFLAAQSYHTLLNYGMMVTRVSPSEGFGGAQASVRG